MRAGDAPVRYLVGTPKGRLTRLEQAFLAQDLAGGGGRRSRSSSSPRRGNSTSWCGVPSGS